MKNKKIRNIIITIIITTLLFSIYLLYYYNLIPHKSYNNEYFNITTYKSSIDYDEDGIDDQTDILNSAREYVKTKPKYKSKYYSSGYPDDQYGVCTDVVAFAMLGAGYDLQQMVSNDIKNKFNDYSIDKPDKNIDFRRVKNLNIFFKNNARTLTNDLKQIEAWQGGDIVVFTNHIAVVSDKRNRQGTPYIIHNAGQPVYEEDAINRYKIIGHYRWK